jgi:hypothetical protein
MAEVTGDKMRFLWFCGIGVFICVSITCVCLPFGLRTDFVAGLAAACIFSAMLFGAAFVAAVPMVLFGKFREGGYKLSLKQIFMITAVVAAVCAIAGYVVRGY